MKKVYLVRHAKSSWKDQTLEDLDRPIKGRGIRDAHNSSIWLKDQGAIADLIVSSPATRALHTAMIFAKTLGINYSGIEISEDIYVGPESKILSYIQNLDNSIGSVMIFGHNPTLTNFVNKRVSRTITNVPTSGIACLSFEVDSWQDCGNTAELLFFDYPKMRK